MAHNEYGMKKNKKPWSMNVVCNFRDVREVEYRAVRHFTSKIVTPQLKKTSFLNPFEIYITYTYHEFIS